MILIIIRQNHELELQGLEQVKEEEILKMKLQDQDNILLLIEKMVRLIIWAEETTEAELQTDQGLELMTTA